MHRSGRQQTAPVLVEVSRSRGCCQSLAARLGSAQAEDLAAAHRALADPTRVQMVHLLKQAKEPVCVCDFTAVFDLSQPTVSHHLATLRRAGIVDSFRKGIWTFHSLRSDLAPTLLTLVDAIP